MSPLGYTILVGNGKGERRPYWGLTCTWDHAAEGDDEMKVMWMWMWMSATQIQVPEFNGAVDLSCRSPPGANLVCPCEIYVAPGLPM